MISTHFKKERCQGIYKVKLKVALNEKRKKLRGFSFSINMTNSEAFWGVKKLSANLSLLKCDLLNTKPLEVVNDSALYNDPVHCYRAFVKRLAKKNFHFQKDKRNLIFSYFTNKKCQFNAKMGFSFPDFSSSNFSRNWKFLFIIYLLIRISRIF